MSTIDFLFWATGKALYILILISIAIWLICVIYKYDLLRIFIEILRESEQNDASLEWVDARKARNIDGFQSIQQRKGRS